MTKLTIGQKQQNSQTIGGLTGGLTVLIGDTAHQIIGVGDEVNQKHQNSQIGGDTAHQIIDGVGDEVNNSIYATINSSPIYTGESELKPDRNYYNVVFPELHFQHHSKH